MSFTYEYPRPMGTADAALVSPERERPEILLIRRGQAPYAGCFALPGGFMDLDETPQRTAERELQEETNLSGIALRPLFTCAQPGRDPRGRSLTMVYGALVQASSLTPRGGDDAAEARWFCLDELPEMAFDHARVVAQIAAHLRWQASTSVIGRDLLPADFSAEALLALHERVLGRRCTESPLDRGIRLGLIQRAANGCWRFVPPADSGYPDWEPLVW
ncbi:MAG TPA: NUDIX hydrolase [Candidatus Ozemobacteraceae bacterium]|nr:NUDIX hydrolase [Candidatus Ozemobacteraceae bacterium]